MWCNGLSFEKWEEENDSNYEIISYLHGRCDKWVNMNYQKGDRCIAITEFRDEVGSLCLMHSCLLRNGKYVDVRGETESLNNIIEGFDWGEYAVEMYNSIEEFNLRMKQLGLD